MTPTPIEILIDEDTETVLYEGEIVAWLTHFELEAAADDARVHTRVHCTGCFPRKSGDIANRVHPLKIYAGDTPESVFVAYKHRPIGRIQRLVLKLDAYAKRVIRVYLPAALPDGVQEELLSLGVEFIISEDPNVSL